MNQVTTPSSRMITVSEIVKRDDERDQHPRQVAPGHRVGGDRAQPWRTNPGRQRSVGLRHRRCRGHRRGHRAVLVGDPSGHRARSAAGSAPARPTPRPARRRRPTARTAPATRSPAGAGRRRTRSAEPAGSAAGREGRRSPGHPSGQPDAAQWCWHHLGRVLAPLTRCVSRAEAGGTRPTTPRRDGHGQPTDSSTDEGGALERAAPLAGDPRLDRLRRVRGRPRRRGPHPRDDRRRLPDR